MCHYPYILEALDKDVVCEKRDTLLPAGSCSHSCMKFVNNDHYCSQLCSHLKLRSLAGCMYLSCLLGIILIHGS